MNSDDIKANQPFNLDTAIENISHWLPTQGPIKDFIHHNTLHAVQHYSFHKGVAIAARVFGARSYLSSADYQNLYKQGRIKDFAIDWAIAHSEVEPEQYHLIRENLFVVENTEHYPPISLANHGIRNSWLSYLEVDLNSLVHPIMFRLLGNFLDQGISQWTLSKKDESFWMCIWRLAHNSLLPLYPFEDAFIADLLNQSPDQVIVACLERLVGNETLYEQYLLEMLLAHPGWSGMVRLIELNPKVLLQQRNITLKQMLAVELLVEFSILIKKRGQRFINVANTPHLVTRPLLSEYQNTVTIPINLKIWHEAMEYSLYSELLLALKAQNLDDNNEPNSNIQALFCIDDRECSLRRYLEEINPNFETFGAAGFFGIDFLYQGFDDAYPVAQCPNIIDPKHLILESKLETDTEKKTANIELSDLHIKSHSILTGWIFTQMFGIGYAFRMLWDVFRPGSKLLKLNKLSEVEAHTHLHLLRENDELTEDGRLLGFSYIEMTDKIESLLRNIGLTKNFAPLVAIIAHGSSSTNNPHFAAYDCGACSGKPGAPNARAFALMANHPSVREILRDRGIDIPATSFFIAALHNTCRDEITYYDKHLFDQYPIDLLQTFQQTMDEALRRNALERCRWFELGPQSDVYEDAHEHVVARATSIFEPRPELNHSNNLYCVVGRRSLTKNLFLDRRSFLHSYDPNEDPEGHIIIKILSAIIPVCGGINLEYLFSSIDNSVYGAGTKLPHNVIGLLGVANGVEGDLRTGLPSQMIEVHEPARLLIVIEQTTELLDKAFCKMDDLKEWLDYDWVRLVACNPVTRDSYFYHSTGWESAVLPADSVVPSAAFSKDIFIGQNGTIPVHILRKNA